MLKPYLQDKLNGHAPTPEHEIDFLKGRIKDLEREVEQWRVSAQDDIRSQIIFSDRKQATEIKFRQLKATTQAMKKMGKQVSLALRYIAQSVSGGVSPDDIADDLLTISQIFSGQIYWGHEEFMLGNGFVSTVKAADLIKTTQHYRNLLVITKGRDANE